RRIAVSAAGAGDRIRGAQRRRCRAVRRPSLECGVGGMGGGAQNPSLHFLPAADLGRLWLVRKEAAGQPLSAGRIAVCTRADGEADGDHASICPVAARFLAAAAFPANSTCETCTGKTSSARTLRCQCGDHALRAARRRRRRLDRTLAARNSPEKRRLFLSDLRREDRLALRARCVLSPSRERAYPLEGCRRSSGIDCDYGPVLAFPRTPLSAGRLAVVPGNACTGDRNRPGRTPGMGGPLRLLPSLGIVCNRRMVALRSRHANETKPRGAGSDRIGCAARVFRSHTYPDRILAQQLQLVRAGAASDRT